MNQEMFLPERVQIINRANELKGMLNAIQEYMLTFYPDDEATKRMFQSARVELEEIELMALGQYGRWEKLESLLEKMSQNGN